MAMVDKVQMCTTQLGLDASVPLVEQVDAIAEALGLSKEIAAKANMIEKVDAVHAAMFGKSLAVAEAVVMGSAVQVPVTLVMDEREDEPRDDMASWLAAFPITGGPRQDQLQAYSWFDQQGWAAAWPLHRAAMRGEVETIHALCAGGADPNGKMAAWFDSEPLGWAASLGQLGAVVALIQCGADPLRPKNKAGFTPLSDAHREKHAHVISFLSEYSKRRRAAAKGKTGAADPAAELFDYGRYPNGGPRPDQSLCCISIFCAAPFALCPLHCLSAWGCTALVDAITCTPGLGRLPIAPCSSNSINPLWCCAQPLGWAASLGQLHTVMALVKNGANPDTYNAAGHNAYSDAGRERHTHVIEWLTEWQNAGRPRGRCH